MPAVSPRFGPFFQFTLAKGAYIRSVWRLTRVFVILANFVEVVFVELAHKAGKVTVFEVFRKDGFCKFFALMQ